MPYISQGHRDKYRKMFNELNGISTPGQLNYLITCLVKEYIGQNKITYTMLNDIMGALESAKQEFYRRVVVLYEEKKIEDNGDVY